MATERLQRQIERLLDEAEEAVSQLDWTSVRDRAQAVLAFDPGNEDAKGFWDAAERALGDPGAVTTAPAASTSPTVYASSPPRPGSLARTEGAWRTGASCVASEGSYVPCSD